MEQMDFQLPDLYDKICTSLVMPSGCPTNGVHLISLRISRKHSLIVSNQEILRANHVSADDQVGVAWRSLLASETDVTTSKGSWQALKQLTM